MNFKDYFFNKLFTLRRLFLWGNIVLLLLFLVMLAQDHDRGWKDFQKEFKKKEIATAKEKLASAQTEGDKVVAQRLFEAAKRSPIEIRQLWVQELETVDRCITCHLGYDSLANSSLTTDYQNHPFSATGVTPALEIHKQHDFQKFGCVVCHGGQGLATEVDAAHGYVEHWDKPLLKGTMLQASCIQCHDNVKELTFNGDVYPSEVIRAKELFRENGCIGCHQIGGAGGPISVDLKHETSVKPLSRIAFPDTGLSHQDRSLENWIKIHFTRDPVTFVKGDPKGEFNTEPIAPSGMPPFMMNEKDADALTAFVLGLNRKDIPSQYLVLRPPEPEPVFGNILSRGRGVYDKYGCAGCHGADARGGVRNYNYQYDVTPNLRQAVSSYNRRQLREKINEGVPMVAKKDPDGSLPPFYMPAWKNKINREEMDALIAYLFSIKE